MLYEEEKREEVIQEIAGTEEAAGQETTEQIDTKAAMEELRQALAAERERAEANRAGWQRAQADFENYKKRSAQERSELIKNANAALILRLLAVVDDMERAFRSVPEDMAQQPWVEGMRLIEQKLLTILEQEGVKPYEALGQEFDPAYHEAVTIEETDPDNDGKVIGEIQKGYRLHDRVLRPALVKVGKGRKENKA